MSDSMTTPLTGLCDKPLESMSDEELRDFVVYLNTLRQSHQTFKAAMQQGEEKVKSKATLGGMEGFF